MNIKYIGICGTKGSGKTTAANIIINELERNGNTVVVLPFAQGIKQILATVVSMINNMSYNEALKYFITPELKEVIIPKINATARNMMIAFGTDFVRSINNDLWIEYIQNELDKIAYEYDVENLYVIFDDIRFENEHNFVQDNLNGIMFYITRDKWEFSKNIFVKAVRYIGRYKKHKSEYGVHHLCNSESSKILNLTTKEELAEKVLNKLYEDKNDNT